MKPSHEAYDPIVEAYASAGEDDPVLRARARKLIVDLSAGKRILEVGCGPGLDAAALSRQGMAVTAIDLSSKFILHARRIHPGVDFRCMDMRAPEFDDGSFDGILGMACFCHLSSEEVSAALSCYQRLLRPGGAIVLFSMDSQEVDGYVVEDWGGMKDNRVQMVCHDRNWLDAELKSTGFHRTEIIPVQSPYYEAIPRIQENGIKLYFATGLVANSAIA